MSGWISIGECDIQTYTATEKEALAILNEGKNYMIKARKMCDRYAPKNPSGYPAVVYKICTLTQWNEYWNEQNQFTLFQEVTS